MWGPTGMAVARRARRLVLNPAAYQALVSNGAVESSNRPRNEIRLTREAFDGLPHEVQHLLMEQPG
jgi:hypothetical protein